MTEPERFHWSHAVALLVGAVGCYLIFTNGPMGDTRDARKLVDRLHRATLQRDSAEIAFKRLQGLDSLRRVAVQHLEAREALSARQTHSLAIQNGELARRLAQGALPPETVVVMARQLAEGIANQDSACSSALQDCAAVKDTLRRQIADRDTLIGDLRTHRDSALGLAGDAVALESKTRRTLNITRILAVLAVLGVGILK